MHNKIFRMRAFYYQAKSFGAVFASVEKKMEALKDCQNQIVMNSQNGTVPTRSTFPSIISNKEDISGDDLTGHLGSRDEVRRKRPAMESDVSGHKFKRRSTESSDSSDDGSVSSIETSNIMRRKMYRNAYAIQATRRHNLKDSRYEESEEESEESRKVGRFQKIKSSRLTNDTSSIYLDDSSGSESATENKDGNTSEQKSELKKPEAKPAWEAHDLVVWKPGTNRNNDELVGAHERYTSSARAVKEPIRYGSRANDDELDEAISNPSNILSWKQPSQGENTNKIGEEKADEESGDSSVQILDEWDSGSNEESDEDSDYDSDSVAFSP